VISPLVSRSFRPDLEPLPPDFDPPPGPPESPALPPPRSYPDRVIDGAELFIRGPAGAVDDGVDIHYNDVLQGEVGNCFLMAAIAAIAERNPEEIRNLFRANHNTRGEVISYTVTLWEKTGGVFGIGQRTVPREFNFSLPIQGGPNQARPGDNVDGKSEIWPLLLERAYSQMNSGSGGDPADAFFALTGREASNHYNKFIFSDVHWLRLRRYIEAGQAVVLGTKEDANAVAPAGLRPNHAYTVTGTREDANGRILVQLYDPHGRTKEVFADDLSLWFQSITNQG
jgi:hypothetical protein